VDQRTRDLRNACEPIGANVYFAPEAHQRYTALGLNYASGYFCSRGASLGKPSGMVVAAAFGVFSPAVVVPAVDDGWSKTDPDTILHARHEGAVASLRRLLGDPDESRLLRAAELLQRAFSVAEHAGHPLYAGLRSLPFPGEPLAQLWRCCDMIREHRGDSHIAVWTRAGLRPIEIQLLSEIQLGITPKTYSATRGWTPAQMDAALDEMRARGWLDAQHALTAQGAGFRDRIESETDEMEVHLIDAIGTGLDELLGLLRPWASAVVAAGIEGGGYPGNIGAVGRMSSPRSGPARSD
jgi:hypothetical protein